MSAKIMGDGPAAPVVAEGWALKRKDGSGYGGYMFRSVEQAENHNKTNAMGHLYKVVGVNEVAAHPVAGSPADGAQTDLAKRLLEIAGKTGGQHSAVSVLKVDLIAICCEANRYYDGMLAWKKTAEKKDADWIAERCAARITATPVPASEAPYVPAGYANETDFLRSQLSEMRTNIKAHRAVMAKRDATIAKLTAAPVPASEAANELSKLLREVAANPKADAISYLKARMVEAANEIDRLAAPAAPTDARPEEIVAIAARIFGLKPHKMDEEHKAKYLQFASEVQLMQDRERNPQ